MKTFHWCFYCELEVKENHPLEHDPVVLFYDTEEKKQKVINAINQITAKGKV